LSLRWFRDQFAGSGSYDSLMIEAAAAPAGSDGLLWAPYLMASGRRISIQARAAHWLAYGAAHAAHVIRAILEGVAFSLRDTFTIFRELGVPVKSIRLGGGGARSYLWQQIQADIYGMPVDLVAAEEGAAYGAALIAGVGAGTWASVDVACETAVRVAKRVEPIAKNVELMNRRYQEYRKLYPALRGIGYKH